MEQIHGYLWIWILIWCRSSLNEKINPNSSPTFPRRLSLQAPRRSSLQAPRHKKTFVASSCKRSSPQTCQNSVLRLFKGVKTNQNSSTNCRSTLPSIAINHVGHQQSHQPSKVAKMIAAKSPIFTSKVHFQNGRRLPSSKVQFLHQNRSPTSPRHFNNHRQKLSKLFKTCQKVKLVKRSKFVFCCQDTTNDVNKTCLQDNFDRHTQNFKSQIQPRPWWTQQPWWTPTTTADFAKLTRPRMFPIPFSTGQPKPFNFW